MEHEQDKRSFKKEFAELVDGYKLLTRRGIRNEASKDMYEKIEVEKT